MMKELILVLLTAIGPFLDFQKIRTCTLKETYRANEEIVFTVNNETVADTYIGVELEKNKNGEWVNYSHDVFSQPEQPLELTLIVKAGESKALHFIITHPNWANLPNYEERRNQELNEKLKTGKFRLKINYGSNEYQKKEFNYSNEFIIYP